MSEKKEFGTALTKINDNFMPLIAGQMQKNNIQMSAYSKECVLHAISAINAVIDKAGLTWMSPDLDKSTVSDILIKIACFQLNAASSPREVYFQLRNVKTTQKDESGRYIYKKQVEMGIEGDGNDSILSRFGRGVQRVCQIWKVREGDEFSYPRYTGLEMSPPEWIPHGEGKLSKIVYPIIMQGHDGKSYVEFYIAERKDVIRNLIAHINSNLMNETFGVAESRYKATEDQRKKIDQKKKELLKKADSLGLDAALDDEELQQYISPAWTELHSREAMIERKMRNNAIKKIPKDFGNGAMETMFEEATNEGYRAAAREIAAEANKTEIDIDPSTGEVKELPEPQEQPSIPAEETARRGLKMEEAEIHSEPENQLHRPQEAPFLDGLDD